MYIPLAKAYPWKAQIDITVHSSSVAQSCPIICDPMNHCMPGLPVHHQLPDFPKLMFIESVMPSRHLILSCLFLLLPPIPHSIRGFQWVNSSHEVGKVLEFQLQHQSFQWTPSFRMDWLDLDLLAVQGTLKSLFQHRSSKTSILQCSAFFRVQLSHPYMTTGKIIALTTWT